MNVEKFLPEEFKLDEKDYWQARNNLLSDYEGKWIAFHNKKVIASGDNIYEVTFLALQKSNSCAYITKVGEEDKLMVKVRRQEFSYNLNYQPFPLPQAKIRFYRESGKKAPAFMRGDAVARRSCEARSKLKQTNLVVLTRHPTVNDGTTLTVEAGVVVKFNPNLQLMVYGTLDVNGADGNNVVFTSRDDNTTLFPSAQKRL